MQPTNIIIADPEFLTRKGLRVLLAHEEGLVIRQEVENEQELLKVMGRSGREIIVLDYNQPKHFSTVTVTKIKQHNPEAIILVITADNNKANIYQVLETGVRSFLTKTCDEKEVLDAFRALVKGEKFYCNRILDYLLEKSFSPQERKPEIPLTPREIEVVRLIARGLIAKEIGNELNLSTHTIYTHRKNIMKKLKINSASELVMYALNTGLIESPVDR